MTPSNLPVLGYVPGSGLSRLDRAVGREIAQARGYSAVLAARETSKIEAVANVTEAGLVATAHVSSIESLLIGQVPHAEARLRHIADAGTAGMAYVVMAMSHQLR